MSSGNPFRRAQKQDDPHPSTPLGDRSSASSQLTAQQQQPLPIQSSIRGSSPMGKTKKTVRIRSPNPTSPISPNYFSRTIPLPPPHTDFPSPPMREPSPDSSEDTPTDPFENTAPSGDLSSDDEEMIKNTRQNAGAQGGASSSSGMPFNPFSRTLATMESGAEGSMPKNKKAQLDGTTGKAAMDVDSFTRMLMTGKSDQGSSVEATKSQVKLHSHGPAVDSNSSTDTSSLSRQSLLETVQAPQLETPRTSYEMSHSDDDEETSLMGEGRKVEKERDKKKPPPPKPRHGKLVAARTPQTVSFSDFSPTAPSQSLPSPTLQRSPTDLNKPLPALPEQGDLDPHEQSKVYERTPAISNKEAEMPHVEEPSSLAPQKKVAPPVPLARRQSQLRTATQSRHRSNSAMTTGSQDSSHAPSIAESTSAPQSQNHKMAPPPPPSRRHASSLSNSINNSAEQSTSALSSPTDGPRSPTNRASSGGSLAQALSGANALGITTSQHSSQGSLSSPPPPPPPRRRQSSGRVSLDLQRPSLDMTRGSFDIERRSSVASSLTSPRKESGTYVQNTLTEEPESTTASEAPAKQTEAPQSDILADMEAFQREIDALRMAHEGGGKN